MWSAEHIREQDDVRSGKSGSKSDIRATYRDLAIADRRSKSAIEIADHPITPIADFNE